MLQRKFIAVAAAFAVIYWITSPSAWAADPARVQKTTGSLPKPAAVAYASGSGVIVGKRLVLTNRHIARDDDGKLFDGFRIYTGPDYKQSQPARVVAVCENYDLALLETSADMPFRGVTLFDGLAPLSERVTAFGFPLGSRFGVGLTTTGGQVSRHPVAAARDDDEEDAAIKAALWHDAVLTSGNSGGPLFTASNVLVGINFAYLSTDSQHALAVPGNVVADFLRRASAAGGVTMTKSGDGAAAADPKSLTVFIESMIDDVRGRAANLDGASSMGDMIIATLKTRLPAVSAAEFRRVEAGELFRAFPPKKSADLEAGEIARVRGNMTVDTLFGDQGMLTTVDKVQCFVIFPPGGADEIRSQLAKNPNPTFALDQVYFIGPPVTIRTSAGAMFALALMPLKDFAKSSDFQKAVAAEKERRAVAAGAPASSGLNDRNVERYLTQLQRTFTDASGQFRTDAAAVFYDSRTVRLIRMSDKQKITVPTDRLSREDRVWLLQNENSIRQYGGRLEQHYDALARAAAGAAATNDK
jgi:S1-C subfamily serine protease